MGLMTPLKLHSPSIAPVSRSARSSPSLPPTAQASSSSSASASSPAMRAQFSRAVKHTPGHASSNSNSSSSSAPNTHVVPQQPPPVKLSFRIESPPLVLYGKPTESTGALLSGVFTLDVRDASFPLKRVHIAIEQIVKTLKPHSGTCVNCLNRTTELCRWEVLAQAADLPNGPHAYPFSHLIPGSVPAQTENHVFSVEYKLVAVAVPDNDKHCIMDANKPEQKVKFNDFEAVLPLNIKRSIIRGPDKNSVRVFPPTEIVANVTIPSSVFPDSSFPLELLVEGISGNPPDPGSRHTRWRMRKVTWRIDEEAKIRTFRCPAHSHVPLDKYTNSGSHGSPKTMAAARQAARYNSPMIAPMGSRSRTQSSTSLAGSASASPAPPRTPSASRTPTSHPSTANSSPQGTPQDSPQGTPQGTPLQEATELPPPLEEYFIEDTRSVSSAELKTGWKTDFTEKGKVEFLANVTTAMSKVACDIEDPTFGLHCSHLLVMEIIVASETVIFTSKNTAPQVMPTGNARVLRMQFKMTMTERSGLGISWDDEVPPKYDDVPMSPPEYNVVGSGHHGGTRPVMEEVSLDNLGLSPMVRPMANSPGPNRASPLLSAALGSSSRGRGLANDSLILNNAGSTSASPSPRLGPRTTSSSSGISLGHILSPRLGPRSSSRSGRPPNERSSSTPRS